MDNYARIQISYDGDLNRVVVKIDPQNHGHYQDCLTETLSLPEGWWKKAHIGISASTGDLADNHDLIEVSTMLGITSTDSSLQAKEEEQLEMAREESLKNLLKTEGVDVANLNPKEMALFALVKEMNDKQGEELQKLKRELEHSMSGEYECVLLEVAIDDSINSMIRKLQQRGDVSETRISELESTMQNRVGSSLTEQIQNRISVLEKMLDNSLKQEVKKKSSSWILPFLLLSVVLSIVFFFVYVPVRSIVLCVEAVQTNPENAHAIACLFHYRLPRIKLFESRATYREC